MGAVVAIAAMFAAAFIIYSARDGDAVGADATTSATPGAPMVEITATDFAFQGPSQLEAGPAAITFVNAGQEEHHAIFLRLNDGVSAEQLTAALPEGPAAVLRLTTIHGGAQTAPPGTSQHATLDLSAGHYVFLCFVQGEDGVPHAAKGMMHALDVTAGAAQASSPKADVAVSLQDFSFGMSVPPTAGPQTWEIINRGPQPHELALYTLAPGKTFDDVAAYVQNPNGPRPVTRVSGVELLTEGERAWIDLDLAAGGYVLVCTIPDPASGKEHVDLGMLATFTVASP